MLATTHATRQTGFAAGLLVAYLGGMTTNKSSDRKLIRSAVDALIQVECWSGLVVSLQVQLNDSLWFVPESQCWVACDRSKDAREELIDAIKGLRERTRAAEALIVEIRSFKLDGIGDVVLDSIFSMRWLANEYHPWLDMRIPGRDGLLHRPREIAKAYRERLAPVERLRERLQVVSDYLDPLDTRAGRELSNGERRIWLKLSDGRTHKADAMKGPGAATEDAVRQTVARIREKLGKDAISGGRGRSGGYFRPDRRKS